MQKHARGGFITIFGSKWTASLKSWAVTRGPSLIPGEKRLAVDVEDHPLDYGSFEGTIPKGEYGGGSVIVWDRGTWTPIGDPHKGLAKGHLEFELHGEKLKGRWHLVRMRRKPREKHDNWLLIKGEDEVRAARRRARHPRRAAGVGGDRAADRRGGARGARLVVEDGPHREGQGKDRRQGASRVLSIPVRSRERRKAPMPDFVAPMLASLVKAPLAGERWLHEIKFDGYGSRPISRAAGSGC